MFCLVNPYWWLKLWQSSLNVSLAWYFNLFGVKTRILNLPNVQHVTISKFLWISPREKSANFYVKWKLCHRTTTDTHFDFLKSVFFFFFFEIAFSYFSIWILNSESSGHNHGIFVKKSGREDRQFVCEIEALKRGYCRRVAIWLSIVLIYSNHYFIDNSDHNKSV